MHGRYAAYAPTAMLPCAVLRRMCGARPTCWLQVPHVQRTRTGIRSGGLQRHIRASLGCAVLALLQSSQLYAAYVYAYACMHVCTCGVTVCQCCECVCIYVCMYMYICCRLLCMCVCHQSREYLTKICGHERMIYRTYRSRVCVCVCVCTETEKVQVWSYLSTQKQAHGVSLVRT